MSPPNKPVFPKFPGYTLRGWVSYSSDEIRDAELSRLELMWSKRSAERASVWAQSIHTALGLVATSSSPGRIMGERWRRWRANRLAAKAWEMLHRNMAVEALEICQKSLRLYPFCASARELHARLALLAEDKSWHNARGARDSYIAWLALAVLEQKNPPSCKVRHEELVWFIWRMMWVNAERLSLKGLTEQAEKQRHMIMQTLARMDIEFEDPASSLGFCSPDPQAFVLLLCVPGRPLDPEAFVCDFFVRVRQLDPKAFVRNFPFLIIRGASGLNDESEAVGWFTRLRESSAQTAMAEIARCMPRESPTASAPVYERRR